MLKLPVTFLAVTGSLLVAVTGVAAGQTSKPLEKAGIADGSSGRAPGSTFRDCAACPEMVVIPAGKFIMGSSVEEKSWAASHGGSAAAVADEAPQREVSVPSFALGKYDVTRDEYAAFVRETGYPAGDGCGGASLKWTKDPARNWQRPGFEQSERDPVICISWQDAHAYIKWLNHKAKSDLYHLPSEAEWEYAARGGTTTKFWWGDDASDAPAHAWFNEKCSSLAGGDGVVKRLSDCASSGGRTHPVGGKPANGFGLYDIVGNVWQWTEDCYDTSYAPAPTDGRANETASRDPSANDSHGKCLRVDRGGSWMFPAWLLGSARRERNPEDFRDIIMGLRVAKTLP